MGFRFGFNKTKNGITTYVKDKRRSYEAYKRYFYIRLHMMFKYENLPDTIPQYMLEDYLLRNGTCFITRASRLGDEEGLYAFIGGFGGEPDAYYRPTRYIVANPYLKLSKDYDLWEDGVLIRNDELWYGLDPLVSRYAYLMAENAITLRQADIMLRIVSMISASDDKTLIAAKTYMKKMEDGELEVIGESKFFDGVKMQSPPSNNGSYLTQFIELQQYYKGSFFNEIGLQSNYNMKREAIGEGESTLDEDSIIPLYQNMLKCRQDDIARVNEMFGTDIQVSLDSVWEKTMKELEVASQLVGDVDGQKTEDIPIDGMSEGDGRSSNDMVSSESEIEESNKERQDESREYDGIDRNSSSLGEIESSNEKIVNEDGQCCESNDSNDGINVSVVIENNMEVGDGSSRGCCESTGNIGDVEGE